MKYIFTFFLFLLYIQASEISAMQEACEDRSMAEVCYDLGAIYSGEDGLTPHLDKSQYYLKKACELGEDKACKLLEDVQEKLSHK